MDTMIGRHNANLDASIDRIHRGATYKNAATIIVIPTRGTVHIKTVLSWRNLMTPMNHPSIWFPMIGLEVGAAYAAAVENIRHHPELSKWPYVLTLEEDNMPPPDGLLKLIESLESNKNLGAVGGLYWTKGDLGQPMIYGDPTVMPMNFMPQVPQAETLQRCNGLGMGFTLFRTKMLLDPRLPQPVFRTVQSYQEGVGGTGFTQDLWFFQQAGKLGYHFACDTRVKVGHYDQGADIVW